MRTVPPVRSAKAHAHAASALALFSRILSSSSFLMRSVWCALNHEAHSQKASPGFRSLVGAGLFPGAALPHLPAVVLVKDGKEIRRLHGLPAVGHARRQP